MRFLIVNLLALALVSAVTARCGGVRQRFANKALLASAHVP